MFRNSLCVLLALYLPAFAANKYWKGGATDVRQLDSVTFAGVYAPGDKVRVTCGSKYIELTVGTDITLADVAAETAAMIDAANRTDGLTGATLDETRNFGGEQIPQFAELDAYSVGAVLWVESTTPGVPFDITVTETAAAGTATMLSDGTGGTVLATGENWYDNTDNWVTGIPLDGDTAVLNRAAPSILYGLTHIRDNSFTVDFVCTTDFNGSVGLPAVRIVGQDTSFTYPEYRKTLLEFYGSPDIKFISGINDVTANKFKKLDMVGCTPTVTVQDAGAFGSAPGVYLRGGAYSPVIANSYVTIDSDENPPGVGDTTLGAIKVGTNGSNNCKVILGATIEVSADTTIEQAGGEIVSYATLHIDNTHRWTIFTHGVFKQMTATEVYNLIVHNNGQFFWIGGGEQIGTMQVEAGGTFSLAQLQGGILWNNPLDLFPGSTADLRTIFNTPNTITINGGTRADVTLLEY